MEFTQWLHSNRRGSGRSDSRTKTRRVHRPCQALLHWRHTVGHRRFTCSKNWRHVELWDDQLQADQDRRDKNTAWSWALQQAMHIDNDDQNPVRVVNEASCKCLCPRNKRPCRSHGHYILNSSCLPLIKQTKWTNRRRVQEWVYQAAQGRQ